MKSLAKSENTIRELKEKLAFRFAGSSSIDTVRQDRDSNGWAMLFCSDGGNEAAGQPVIAIRVKSANAVSKDVLGNDLFAFSPHELELAYEKDTTEGEPSRKDLAKALLECSKLGMKLIVKEIADGTAVSASSMDAATDVESHEYEVIWPSKGL